MISPRTNPASDADPCQAQLKQVECELQVERLRREERENAEERARQRKQREEDRKELRRRQRRETRFQHWQAFWQRRRQRREAPGSSSGPIYAAMLLGAPALLALVIYAFALSTDTGETLAIGLLTAAAAFAVGALLGFLFGIPRSLSAPAGNSTKDAAASEAPAENGPTVRHYTANTNLEQISDWLTKILVGVGLVQIHQISGAVEDLANGLAPGLGPDGTSVAVALLVAFSITGFVSAYLFTRLRLQGQFEIASLVTLVTEQANKQTSAIALVQQQLTPGGEKPKLEDLVKALKAADRSVREQAFFMARRQTLEDWGKEGDEDNEELVGLPAPIFEALIACDTEKRYHRSRAELGYLRLKLHRYPAAKTAFDEAIEVRPAHLLPRTPRYEFNRAYCAIKLDPNFTADRPSDPAAVEAICADLEAVVDLLAPKKAEKPQREEVVKWLKRNSEGNERIVVLLTKFEKMDPANR